MKWNKIFMISTEVSSDGLMRHGLHTHVCGVHRKAPVTVPTPPQVPRQLPGPHLSHPRPRAFLPSPAVATQTVLGSQRNLWSDQAGESQQEHLQNLGWLGASGRWEIQWTGLSSVTLSRLWKPWPSQAKEKTHRSSNFCLIIWHSRPVLGPPCAEGGRTVSPMQGRFSCPAPQQIPGVTNGHR